ncbi:hypothetical protein CWI84_00650 [Idiomarina tyrosinivorans]|uniref:Uncharacterized protein n=1 Tax=Idiomarina tyrosinivorans TaxID=1445662 RepID=A0A432ZTN9_9GAMM|nr:TonB-dependent receptor [Idiomarina tyrosinivorans]RUO81304.1 hypothetical protein CWI84_00650 [Idiomarina tyrosinivorans]
MWPRLLLNLRSTRLYFSNIRRYDTELAWTRSRFTTDADGEGRYIDGALPMVASIGANWNISSALSTSLRLRHFGERTLDSFNDMTSNDFTVVNWGSSYKIGQWQFQLDALNLFNSNDHDIDYYYASRLAGEPASGIEDVHFHPIEPRTLRFAVRFAF